MKHFRSHCRLGHARETNDGETVEDSQALVVNGFGNISKAFKEADGGYCAECLAENIFTQADTWDELRKKRR